MQHRRQTRPRDELYVARIEMVPEVDQDKRAKVLASVTANWSSTPEVECRAAIIRDGLLGDLMALEREGLVESRKSHTRHRHWRLTERGAAKRRDLEATSAPGNQE